MQPALPATGSPAASAVANAWPQEMAPGRTPVYQRNELVMPVSAERAFAWLVRADLWPRYYDNARLTRLDHTPLVAGARFAWWTFGIHLDTRVAAYEPGRSIAWDAHADGLRAYHKWLFVPEGPGRTRVITEETDDGPIAWLGAGLIRQGLASKHQAWLEGLARVAATGAPPEAKAP